MTGMWAMIGVAVLACYFWRALGVALSNRVDANGPIIRWVGCVAALVAFYALRRNVLAGTAAGVAVVIALAYYGQPLLSI